MFTHLFFCHNFQISEDIQIQIFWNFLFHQRRKQTHLPTHWDIARTRWLSRSLKIITPWGRRRLRKTLWKILLALVKFINLLEKTVSKHFMFQKKSLSTDEFPPIHVQPFKIILWYDTFLYRVHQATDFKIIFLICFIHRRRYENTHECIVDLNLLYVCRPKAENLHSFMLFKFNVCLRFSLFHVLSEFCIVTLSISDSMTQ